MAREPSKKEGGIFGGKGSLKEDLRDISGDKKITFADTWLGDLLGFDGKAGVQGADLKESWYGARRKPYRERVKEGPSLERAVKRWTEARQEKEAQQESLRRSFDDKAAATERAVRSMSRENFPFFEEVPPVKKDVISRKMDNDNYQGGLMSKPSKKIPVDITKVEKGYEVFDPAKNYLTYNGANLTNLPDTKEEFLDLISRAGKTTLQELGLFGLTISDYARAKAARDRILSKTSDTTPAPAPAPAATDTTTTTTPADATPESTLVEPTTELPKGISQTIDKDIFSKIKGKDLEGLESVTSMTKQQFARASSNSGTVPLPENFYYINTGLATYFLDTNTNKVYDGRLNLLTYPPNTKSNDQRQKNNRSNLALKFFNEQMGNN